MTQNTVNQIRQLLREADKKLDVNKLSRYTSELTPKEIKEIEKSIPKHRISKQVFGQEVIVADSEKIKQEKTEKEAKFSAKKKLLLKMTQGLIDLSKNSDAILYCFAEHELPASLIIPRVIFDEVMRRVNSFYYFSAINSQASVFVQRELYNEVSNLADNALGYISDREALLKLWPSRHQAKHMGGKEEEVFLVLRFFSKKALHLLADIQTGYTSAMSYPRSHDTDLSLINAFFCGEDISARSLQFSSPFMIIHEDSFGVALSEGIPNNYALSGNNILACMNVEFYTGMGHDIASEDNACTVVLGEIGKLDNQQKKLFIQELTKLLAEVCSFAEGKPWLHI